MPSCPSLKGGCSGENRIQDIMVLRSPWAGLLAPGAGDAGPTPSPALGCRTLTERISPALEVLLGVWSSLGPEALSVLGQGWWPEDWARTGRGGS